MQDLGSREGIAEAKLEIAAGLKQDGKLIINGDEPLLTDRVGGKTNVIPFGLKANNDYQAKDITLKGRGTHFIIEETEYFIPVLGAHNVTNALAAIIVGELFGVSEVKRKKGLEQLVITGMRNEVVETSGGWTVINDAYNASPTSMRAALDLLGSLDGYGKKIAVLGDMLELGDMEKTFHHEIGQYVKEKNVDYVFTFGALGMEIAKGAQEVMEPSHVKPFMNKQELTRELLPLLENGDVVMVKGSRGMKLEEVIEGIK